MWETGLAIILLAFALGGVLKGAIGAGTPVVTIPIMALHHDVPFAIAVFAVPGVLSNLVQASAYRAHLLPAAFLGPLAAATAAGTITGTVLLATLPPAWLTGGVAAMTLVYVVFRVAQPRWRLSMARARAIVLPVGLAAGLLQGAAGISAPVSLTFLNALGLSRPVFIGSISLFFLSMGVVQAPALVVAGFLTWDRAALGLVATVVLVAAMPAGNWLGRRLGRGTFDRIIMVLLVLIALRLLWGIL